MAQLLRWNQDVPEGQPWQLFAEIPQPGQAPQRVPMSMGGLELKFTENITVPITHNSITGAQLVAEREALRLSEHMEFPYVMLNLRPVQLRGNLLGAPVFPIPITDHEYTAMFYIHK